MGNFFFSLFNILIVLEHLLAVFSICFFQFKVSVMIPRKLNLFTLSLTVASILNTGIFKALLIILYNMYFYLFTLKLHLHTFIFNHSFILANSLFIRISTFTSFVEVLND